MVCVKTDYVIHKLCSYTYKEWVGVGGVHTSLFSFLTAAFRLSQKERKKIKQWQEEKKGGGGCFGSLHCVSAVATLIC